MCFIEVACFAGYEENTSLKQDEPVDTRLEVDASKNGYAITVPYITLYEACVNAARAWQGVSRRGGLHTFGDTQIGHNQRFSVPAQPNRLGRKLE